MHQTAAVAPAISGISRRLVTGRILTSDQARDAETEAKQLGISLIRHLVDTLDVESRELAEIASAEFGLPVFDLDALNQELLPEQKIDSELMTKHHAAPLFRRGNRLFVAVSDPTNLTALEEFKFASGINTDSVLVDDAALSKLISDLSEQTGGFDANMASLGADGEYDLEIGDGVVEEDEI